MIKVLTAEFRNQLQGLEPRLAWDSPTFKGKALFCSLYTEHVSHRLWFTQTTLFTYKLSQNDLPCCRGTQQKGKFWNWLHSCEMTVSNSKADDNKINGTVFLLGVQPGAQSARFKSNGMSTPPFKSTQKKSAVCFSCQLVSVQSVFFLTASVNLPTSNVVRHTVVSAKGMQWTKKTKDYSWIAQLVYLSIAIHVSLRVCLAWQSQTNSKNFKHASAVGSCTTATWIASPIVAAESVFIHLPKIYTELPTLAIKEVSTTHAGTIPLLLVLCWALQTLAHLDLGLTALSAGALLSSIWLFDQLCLLFLLFTCSLRIFMASSQVCRFRTSFAGAGLANFEHIPRSQRLCTCNSTLAIDEVAPCRSLIGVRKCCWKHKQQKRRVKRSLVHHDKSAHSCVQEPTSGSWAKTCLGLTYFQRQSAFLLFVHRTRFTQTVVYANYPFHLQAFTKWPSLLQGYSKKGKFWNSLHSCEMTISNSKADDNKINGTVFLLGVQPGAPSARFT